MCASLLSPFLRRFTDLFKAIKKVRVRLSFRFADCDLMRLLVFVLNFLGFLIVLKGLRNDFVRAVFYLYSVMARIDVVYR